MSDTGERAASQPASKEQASERAKERKREREKREPRSEEREGTKQSAQGSDSERTSHSSASLQFAIVRSAALESAQLVT